MDVPLLIDRDWERVREIRAVSAENLKLSTARKPIFNSSILVAYPSSQPRRMGYPFGSLPTQVGLRGGWKSAGPAKNIQHIWRLQTTTTKINKRNLSESDSENEAADFPRFIVIESLEEVSLVIFSPFLIEKGISTRASPKTVKKTRNGNLLVEVDNRRQAENIKNKNLSYDQMKSVSAWETQDFQGSYQEKRVGIGYRRRDSISPGKTGS